jgi:CDGSH-type Zn-finger protein/truncated hemoglobin YjbI
VHPLRERRVTDVREPSGVPAADAHRKLAALLSSARALGAELAAAAAAQQESSGDERTLRYAALRLQRSVIRPLDDAIERGAFGAGAAAQASVRQPGGDADPAVRHAPDAAVLLAGERLWQLAQDATALRLTPALPTEVQEASAALQDLACRFAPAQADGGPERLAELRAIQAQLPPGVQSQANGPYLVTNVETLTNWLGEPLAARPQMALCRCGQSASKPFCDGTHAEVGFTAEKDPMRVADRRDTYVGQQVTILDNRGICQHSGSCSDRLATVFRVNAEPFVAPSGGRMDEIVRAVRDCPSGALSYAIDGREARDQVDHGGERKPAIEVSKDGPYRVTGAIALIDGDGNDERRNAGASREHYALCRCGHSQNKPFCSGMHWYADFKDPVSDPDREPTIFEWCGGLPALTRMTRLFYEKYVPQDELLAPLFAEMSPDHPERVAKWLGEVFCGPKDYSEQYGGYSRMISQHIGKGLTEEKRARWVALILQSAQEAGLPADPEFRAAFSSYIEWGSRLALENSQPGARPPEHMPMPHWDWQTAAGPPGSRTLALTPTAEDEDQPVVLPVAGEHVSFEKHIKPLFRRRDRQSMKFAFDLWAYDDVKQNAHAILERLQNGSMPCDAAWPAEKVDAFDRWVTNGMNP